MKLFGRRKMENQVPNRPEPRLSGASGPEYSKGAVDAFARVMVAARALSQPDLLRGDHTDAVTELRHAVQVATLYCNDALLARMLHFQEVAVLASMGGAEVDSAERNFSEGCRIALGTND